MSDKIQKIKQEIERRMNNLWYLIPEGEKVLKDDFTKDDANNLGKYTALENLLNFIDSLSEPASKDLDFLVISLEETIGTSPHSREVIKEHLKRAAEWGRNHFEDKSEKVSEDLEEEIDKIWKTCNPIDEGMGVETANIHIEQFDDIAKHFVEWQRKQDESRRNANIALANTDISKDIELEIAFEDIWSDVENCVSDLNKLSNEQKCKLKNAHHDTFEAGVIWNKQQIIKDAVDATILDIDAQTVEFGLWPEKLLDIKEGDKVKIIIVKENG